VNDGVVELTLQFSFLCHFFHPQCTRYGSVSSVAPSRFAFRIYSFKSRSTPPLVFVFQHIFLRRKRCNNFEEVIYLVVSVLSTDGRRWCENRIPQSTLDRKIFRLQNCCSVTTARAVKGEQPSSLMDKTGSVKEQIVSQTTRQQLI
jgi:hypothetical protein